MSLRLIASAAACACLLLPGLAAAHTRGTSYSFWEFSEGRAEVRVRVAQLDLTRLQLDPSFTENYGERVLAVLTAGIRLQTPAGSCDPLGARVLAAEQGWLTARWEWHCPSWQGLEIRSSFLHAVAPSHLHFARVTATGRAAQEHVLTSAAPALVLKHAIGENTAHSSFGAFVALGVEHILSGWDHLAFVLALILLATKLSEVALIATGFTVAHSLTLAGAVLGWVRTNDAVVEALIGFSIALVALENLWQRSGREAWVPWLALGLLASLFVFDDVLLPLQVIAGLMLFCFCHFSLLESSAHPARIRFALAFVFGLVHGFGFAGVLGEMVLPADRLAAALLGFNIGVEFGQLLVIAAAWPLLRSARRWPQVLHGLQEGGSAAILGLGTYWFVLRSFA